MPVDLDLLNYLRTFITEKRQQKFKTILEERTRHFTVAIEDIYQSHNASAVLRSCDIFGVQGVHVIENSYVFKASHYVSKGANKWLDITKYNSHENNTLACIDELKKKGYQIVATTLSEDSISLQEFDVSKKSAFFFGVEKAGLSQDVLQNADVALKIPMYGFTQSLNISVAAAIILQHCAYKMKDKDIAWQLSQHEKDILELEWTKKTVKSIKNILAQYHETKK